MSLLASRIAQQSEDDSAFLLEFSPEGMKCMYTKKIGMCKQKFLHFLGGIFDNSSRNGFINYGEPLSKSTTFIGLDIC